ncbi:MAG: YkvA family protein [Myxococcota bacterium]
MSEQHSDFAKEYSEHGFWDKVRNFARVAGESVLEPALKLFYASQDSETPAWAKAVIYSALGYFISPLDAIPDVTPIVGYADDLGVLVAALATVAAHIKPQHTQRAKETLREWFG